MIPEKITMDDDRIYRRMVEVLRARRIRLTPQRTEIIRIISHDRSHPSARTIFAKAHERVPDMSMSTVYSTLGLLKKEGLIKELEFYDMDNRYETVMTDHIDLICTKCGRITNFENDPPISREYIEESTGFAAERMRFEYYGLCERCRGKKG
jgi:Fur family transcriptional regulator, peroxide stress response regulator